MIESARYFLDSQLLRKQAPGHYRIAGRFDYHHHMLQYRVPKLSTQSTYHQLGMDFHCKTVRLRSLRCIHGLHFVAGD